LRRAVASAAAASAITIISGATRGSNSSDASTKIPSAASGVSANAKDAYQGWCSAKARLGSATTASVMRGSHWSKPMTAAPNASLRIVTLLLKVK
jgi:hypothetical protein